MAFTMDQINELRQVFDREYVRISDCNDIQDKNNNKFANDDKRIDRIIYMEEQTAKALQKNNWLTTAILGVIISTVIGFLLNSIGVI